LMSWRAAQPACPRAGGGSNLKPWDGRLLRFARNDVAARRSRRVRITHRLSTMPLVEWCVVRTLQGCREAVLAVFPDSAGPVSLWPQRPSIFSFTTRAGMPMTWV
jgi:hypothetical protein